MVYTDSHTSKEMKLIIIIFNLLILSDANPVPASDSGLSPVHVHIQYPSKLQFCSTFERNRHVAMDKSSNTDRNVEAEFVVIDLDLIPVFFPT